MKRLIAIFLLVLVISLCACSNNSAEDLQDKQVEFDTKYGDIYRVAFDELMKEDEGLNSDSKYMYIPFQ